MKYPGTQDARVALKRKFSRLFEVSIGNLYDPTLSLCSGRWVIDIIKFDKYLHSKFGNYEEQGLSMGEFVAARFGNEALQLLEELL
ncbi:MAG: hypothetical protein IJ271_05440 [Bacteroidales bacterium]|nr:hypothetical protein [Bacteroidales bacterium]